MVGLNYDYSDTAEQIMSLLYGFISSYFIIVVAVAVLGIVSKWIIFEKAHEGGWKSLIPIYNTYTEYKVVI